MSSNSTSNKNIILSPLGINNPVTVQVLGICSALAVTAQLEPAIVMGLSVTVVSMLLKAYTYDVSVQLSVYVGLIITNCILMGRLEAFAMSNGPWKSLLDGIGNGLGYAWILIVVGSIRELLGNGTLLGIKIIPNWLYKLGYVNNSMMSMPAMALIILGCVIWITRLIQNKNK